MKKISPLQNKGLKGKKISVTGFSFLEIIIVVIISGVLATLGLPQYTKTVEKARAQEAIANLRLIRAAERIYGIQNYNKYYPINGPDPVTAGNQVTVNSNINTLLRLNIDYRDYDFSITTPSGSTFSANVTRNAGGGSYTGICIQIDQDGQWDECFADSWPFPLPTD